MLISTSSSSLSSVACTTVFYPILSPARPSVCETISLSIKNTSTFDSSDHHEQHPIRPYQIHTKKHIPVHGSRLLFIGDGSIERVGLQNIMIFLGLSQQVCLA